jgi:cellulose synthase/poly-beta-1,6-N-acetylglucosamine synthase-like glycosyltransferase
MHALLCAAYFAVLFFLASYGIHRSHLVYTCLRHARRLREWASVKPLGDADVRGEGRKLPHVTVQLPLFNEATVAHRLLDAAAAFDYPRELLEIQVLDDSTDETRSIVKAHVGRIRKTGVDMQYIHRTDRVGYKAGALDAGLKTAKGELVAIFDADFIPPTDFLRNVVPHFEDASIGMVQTRWGHLNRSHSLLTQVEGLMLDGHHLVENRARMAAGWLFNFSGTGGMWRREAISEAGGWQHDTLTEDLDLSYRAQLAGWKFVYRSDVVTPAELPEDVSAFRAQQYRWAKGTVQTARKLLARVLSSDLTFSQKLEAFFHLTPHFAYPLMVTLSVLLLPALLLMPATNAEMMFLIDLPLCVGTTGSLVAFYMMAESVQGRSRREALKYIPALIALGAGLAPHLTRAVFDGMTSMAGEFVRTPKKGSASGRYRARADWPWLEAGLSLFSLVSTIASVHTGHWFATPFAALFAFGYGWVACLVALEQAARVRATSHLRTPAPIAARSAVSSASGEGNEAAA